MIQLRTSLAEALSEFTGGPLSETALAFWKTLGYESERRISGLPSDAVGFTQVFHIEEKFRSDRAHCDK